MDWTDDDTLPPPPPPPPAAFHGIPWRLTDIVIGLAPLVVLRILSATGIAAELPGWASGGLTVFGQFWMLAFPLAMAFGRVGFIPRLPSLERLIIEAAIALPMLFATWGVLFVLVLAWIGLFGRETLPESPLAGARPEVVLLIAALAVFVAPICEEVFFRGLLLNALHQRIAWPVAILLQGLVFGFIHTFGVGHAVIASVLGLALGSVYVWRKTLITPICMHAYQNAAASAVAFLLALSAAKAPYLGVEGERADGGVRVKAVVPGGPAEAAGLQAGDVLTTVDGRPVSEMRDVTAAVRARRVGETIRVEYSRDGETQQANVVLQRPSR
jgi:membrane protease YdiL (CAAX protease family)